MSFDVKFYDAEKKLLTKQTQTCRAENFFWTKIPLNARYYSLNNANAKGEHLTVPKIDNVYIRYNGIDYTSEGGKVAPYGIFNIEVTTRKPLHLNGSHAIGYCYIGKLANISDENSDWKTLYIVNHKGDKPDKLSEYSISDLRQDAENEAVMTADFPLYFRKGFGVRSVEDPLIRAGQSFRLLAIKVLARGNVYAKISLAPAPAPAPAPE